MITLTGDDVITNLFVQPEARDYNSNSKMAGQKYHRAVYDGTIMTVSPEFYEAWDQGQVTSVSISEGKRKAIDAAGLEVEVKAFAFNSYVKAEQLIKLRTGQKDLAKINGQIKAAEKGAEIIAYREIGLTPEEMRALMVEA